MTVVHVSSTQSRPYKLLWASHHYLYLSAQVYLNAVNQRCEVKSPCGCTPSICLLHMFVFSCQGLEGTSRPELPTQPCCPLPGSASAQPSAPDPLKCCLGRVLILIPSTAFSVGLASKCLFVPVPCATPEPQLQLSGLDIPSFLFTDVNQRQTTCSPHLPGGCDVINEFELGIDIKRLTYWAC